jgi:hypothetical protein
MLRENALRRNNKWLNKDVATLTLRFLSICAEINSQPSKQNAELLYYLLVIVDDIVAIIKKINDLMSAHYAPRILALCVN